LMSTNLDGTFFASQVPAAATCVPSVIRAVRVREARCAMLHLSRKNTPGPRR